MVVLDRRVVVHVVAAEIGEGRGSQLHAVQAFLVETMARRLHGSMCNAGRLQFGQKLVQCDRIRGRQRTVIVAPRRHHAGGADARGA